MKANATRFTPDKHNQPAQRHGRYSYRKVLDARKQPIRGLWTRNSRFYAQLTIEDPSTGQKIVRRVPLLNDDHQPVNTVGEAAKVLAKLKVQREEQTMPIITRTPKFSDAVQTYLDWHGTVKDAKRASTVAKERSSLRLWIEHMGETRVNRITRALINSFIAKRQAAGICGRTVNLDVIALRAVLKRAQDDGWLAVLPTQGMRPLKWTAPTRSLVTFQEITRLCDAALRASKNGQQFADYIRLMAYAGLRRNEALALRWNDVDFDHRQLRVGADGQTKNREARTVNFNPKLEDHLRDMVNRRAPDSQWMFPSPQRGDKDVHAQTFRESLSLARKAAGLPAFRFHDCRHTFISFCVMSGIDYMTIARWVGHKDGGVLIGKVYGHLADGHAAAAGERVSFEPRVISREEVA